MKDSQKNKSDSPETKSISNPKFNFSNQLSSAQLNSFPKSEDPSKVKLVGPKAIIPHKERDARFKKVKSKKKNKSCFDCNAKFPQWGSATFGIFVCMNCSGKHRSYGPNVSFIRSLVMDDWMEKQLRQMEMGGNGRFRDFLEESMIEGPVNYSDHGFERYKDILTQEVANSFTDYFNSIQSDPNHKEHSSCRDNEENQKPILSEEKKRKSSPAKYKEDLEDIPEQKVRPLLEQKTKVVMAESKKGKRKVNSEAVPNKRSKRKARGIAGKRIKKVDLNNLVTDDLKVVHKKKLFQDVKTSQKETQLDQTKQSKFESKSNSKIISITTKKFQSEKNLNDKLTKSKMTKFSGFGSDNFGEEGSKPDKAPKITSQKIMKNYGVFGGYGSDNLQEPSNEKNKELQRNQEKPEIEGKYYFGGKTFLVFIS